MPVNVAVEARPEEDIEQLIKRFERGVQKEGIFPAYRSHLAFTRGGQQRRLKHLKAVKRQQKWQRKQARYENRFDKGLHLRGLPKPVFPLTGQEPEQEVVTPKKVATACIITVRKGKLLIIQDKDRSRPGFVTEGMMPGQTLVEVVRHGLKDEVNLDVKLPAGFKEFVRIEVGRTDKYPMLGVVVRNFTGKVKAGEEVVDGSPYWATPEEIDEMIMTGEFLPNHARIFTEFLAMEKQRNQRREKNENL